MNKRSKTIISLLLTMALIFGLNATTFAWVDTYPVYGYMVVNDSTYGEDHEFARSVGSPFSDVMLVSFTNEYQEDLLAAAMIEDAECITLYNEGMVTASDNDPYHNITVQGYDGHGERFYINSNFFDSSIEDIEKIKLGELKQGEYGDYFEPIPGLYVNVESIYKDRNNNSISLNASMDIVHGDYYKDNQTWIRITYTGKEDNPTEDKPLSKEGQIKAYKNNYPNRIYFNDNNDYIEVVSSNFTGKKIKAEVSIGRTIINTNPDNGNEVSEIYDSVFFTSQNKKKIKVKYRNNKNAGTGTAIIKKCKDYPELNGKEIQFEIAPIIVSDNNIQVKSKNGTVKSVKVMTGGKYKKVKKTMWKLVGSQIEFNGNYKGSVSFNNP